MLPLGVHCFSFHSVIMLRERFGPIPLRASVRGNVNILLFFLDSLIGNTTEEHLLYSLLLLGVLSSKCLYNEGDFCLFPILKNKERKTVTKN